MKAYKLALWLSPTGLLVLVIFVLAFIFKAEEPKLSSTNTKSTKGQNFKQIELKTSWQDEIANWTIKDFVPASGEFGLQFDLDRSELIEKEKYHQLVIKKYDTYSLYCLRQVLDEFELRYFMANADDDPEIYIQNENHQILENLSEELKKYKINVEIKEVWL